jgi:hypothetical protein
VELNQVHLFPCHAGQTRLDRALDGATHIPHLVRTNTHLGPDVHVGLEFVQYLPEILLRLAIAIHRSSVEVINASLNRPRHRPHAGTRFLTNDQATDVATAKAQR